MGVLKNDVGRPSNKTIMIRRILKLTAILLIVGLVLGAYFYLNGNKNKNEEKYYILSEKPIEFGPEYSYVSREGDYIIGNAESSIVVFDEQGKQLASFAIGENGGFVSVHGKYFQRMNDGKTTIMDINGNVIKENMEIISIYNGDEYIICNNKNKCGLYDKDLKEIVSPRYETIIKYGNYFVGQTKNNIDVYNSKYKLVLKNETVYEPGVETEPTEEYTEETEIGYTEEYYSYSINEKFAVIVRKNKKHIFYFETGKLSKGYKDASISNSYASYVDNGKTIIVDTKGKIVNTINKTIKNYNLKSKYMIAVQNKTCSNDDEDYEDIYMQSGEKTKKIKCKKVFVNEDAVFLESGNKLDIYYNDKKILSKKTDDEYESNFEYYDDIFSIGSGYDKNEYYDINGKQRFKNCSYVTLLEDGIYSCAPTSDVNYIMYKNEKMIRKEPYKYITSGSNFIDLTNYDGNVDIIDKYNNKIFTFDIDEDSSAYIKDGIVELNSNNNRYIFVIKEVSKEEYKKYIKKNHTYKLKNKAEKKEIDYSSINIDNVIYTYDLGKIKDLIYSNKDLFTKVAYHVINNPNMSKSDKKYFLGMFSIIVDYSKIYDINILLERIDKLIVEVSATKPDSFKGNTVGLFVDGEVTIYLINSHYDYAIEHEYMHFISYSMKGDVNNYLCDNEFRNLDYVAHKIPFNKQKNCEHLNINYAAVLEEAGAEYYTRWLFKNEPYQTYYEPIAIVDIFRYILGEDLNDVEFSTEKALTLYTKLYKLNKYDATKFNDLTTNMEMVSYATSTHVDDDFGWKQYAAFKVADELIDLYESASGKSWKDNEFLKLAIFEIINSYNRNKYTFNKYMNNNPELSIKYSNEYFSMHYESYINNLIQARYGNNSYAQGYHYFLNEGNKVFIRTNAVIDGQPCELNIYYDKNGKVSEIKKKVLDAFG